RTASLSSNVLISSLKSISLYLHIFFTSSILSFKSKIGFSKSNICFIQIVPLLVKRMTDFSHFHYSFHHFANVYTILMRVFPSSYADELFDPVARVLTKTQLFENHLGVSLLSFVQ